MRDYRQSIDCNVVRCLTDDRLWLQGLSFKCTAGNLGLLHIHGLAGNFYENPFVEAIARELVDIGCGMVSVSTRGRDYEADFIRELEKGSKESTFDEVRIGAAHEIMQESVLDIAAWLDVMQSMGYKSIILQGHSLGTLKIANYLAKTRDPRIVACIFLSPADMKGIQIERLGSVERYCELLDLAKTMIALGQGGSYMPDDSFYCRTTARSYADKFSPEWDIFPFSRMDNLPVLSTISMPVLCIYGSILEAVVENRVQEACDVLARTIKDFEYRIVEGSGHSYVGYEFEIARNIKNWITHKKLS